MTVQLPADHTALAPAAPPASSPRLTRPSNGRPLGQRIRVPKTAELVAAELRRKIVRGELAEGDALPSEAALMAEFAVSRPTLREAFRVLESESLISIRRGARGGARVQLPNGNVAASYAGLVLEYRGTTLQDVYDARTFIEAPCAALLAQRRTEQDLAHLKQAVAQAEQLMDDPQAFILAHMEFHALVVELAGNRDAVRAQRHGPAHHRAGQLVARGPGRGQPGQRAGEQAGVPRPCPAGRAGDGAAGRRGRGAVAAAPGRRPRTTC